MRKFRFLSLLLSIVLTGSVVAGCGSTQNQNEEKNVTSTSGDEKKAQGNDSAKEVEIILFNSKGEIQAPLEEAAEAFNKENKGIALEVVVGGAGQSPFEKISSMYAAGNAPALAMLDPGDIPKFADKFLDLSNEKWIADAADKSLDSVKTSDGKVMAFPFTVEGAGFIYNQKVLDQVGIDPSTIHTINDLENSFKKIKDTGIAPVAISPMDWSLAGHFLSISYATQSDNPEDIKQFLEDLKAGKVDLIKNKQFNGLMDTFDKMKMYNIDATDPLAGTYENDQQYMGSDQVGFWFMGNWTWPQIHEFSGENESFGFIPVPISNQASDYGNEGISVGVTKYIGVDKVNNNEDQQMAAKKFLEWLIYSDNGQEILVHKANIIPAFSNITLEPQDPLGKSIKSYMEAGATIQFMTTMPPDHWSQVGASMQKYLAGIIDRPTLAKEIEAYWQNVK